MEKNIRIYNLPLCLSFNNKKDEALNYKGVVLFYILLMIIHCIFIVPPIEGSKSILQKFLKFRAQCEVGK